MKKFFIILLIGLVAAGAVFVWMDAQKAEIPEAAGWFAKDTMFYGGTKSPLKIKAALAFADIEGVLTNDAGLTENEAAIVAVWMRQAEAVHFAFQSFSLLPFALNAAVVLEGDFDRPLLDILPVEISQRVKEGIPWRDVACKQIHFPLNQMFALDVFIADPMDGKLVVAFSRNTLTETLDRMIDGGPSLLENEQLVEMASIREIQKSDTLNYMDLKAYFDMFYGWSRMIPQPELKNGVDLLWQELRIADFECTVSGAWFDRQTASSFSKVNLENPLMTQLVCDQPLAFPFVPATAGQFSFCRLADPTNAMQRVVDMLVRVERGLRQTVGGQVAAPVGKFLGQVSVAFDESPAEFGKLFNGEIGFWKALSVPAENTQATCFYLGITDAEKVQQKMLSVFEDAVQLTNGLWRTEAADGLVWHIGPDSLLLSDDPGWLEASLDVTAPSLADKEEFVELHKKLPKVYSCLSYVDYENGIPIQNASSLPPAAIAVLDLLRGFRQLQVSVVDDNKLCSYQAHHFPLNYERIKTVIDSVLLSVNQKQSVPQNPPFELSAEEAYNQSIELLSDGRQIEAEDLLSAVIKVCGNDNRILLAKAVIDRSRWCNKASANRRFELLRKKAEGSYLSDVSRLQLALDQHKNADDNMRDLLRISNEHPEDIYLLWLSGIQCREQSKREDVSHDFKLRMAQLGKKQYSKLLNGFQVGPVMLHHTYANILTEGLNDYEEALPHRYTAVSMEPKSWTYEGLADTLYGPGRYQLSSVMWDSAISSYPGNDRYYYRKGDALQKLGKYEEMIKCYMKADQMGNPYVSAEIAYCYQNGLGVVENEEKAVLWYRKSVQQGNHWGEYKLAWCYRQGKGVDKNLEAAFELFYSSAKKEYEKAQFETGYSYHKGFGVEQDFKKAAEWYRRAAAQNHVMAWDNLGLLYREGKGVSQDYVEEGACYRKALEINPNFANAMNNYAWMLATCKDESFRNYPKAVDLAERSVDLDEQFYSLDTLAVAYDHNGQYNKAVDAQKQLIDFWQKKNQGKPVGKWLKRRLKNFEEKLANVEQGETINKIRE